MPANAITEPTDRSIPPEIMINVIPRAMMLITAVCRATLERLGMVRKYGERTESAMKSTPTLA